ncbi:MAG: hypothetical protein P8L32_06755 [Paracoccaceae bacterium]|jgi:hypothetical protein|nr:hypothetical protein [Paracoccaceae bacterium]
MQLINDIWKSYRALPLWVQIWVFGILVPVNAFSIVFVAQPSGTWIALLAIVAILINVPVMIIERDFTKTMAISHIPLWTILVVWLVIDRPQGSPAYETYLLVLLVVDLISLGFDYPDAWKWWKARRAS